MRNSKERILDNTVLIRLNNISNDKHVLAEESVSEAETVVMESVKTGPSFRS